MNHWQHEQYKQLDEFSRQQMMAEIRSERLVRHLQVYHPGMFARAMFQFANWMISKGKQLRQRYEIPSAGCDQQTSRNLI